MTHYPDSPQQFMEHVAGKIFAVCENHRKNSFECYKIHLLFI